MNRTADLERNIAHCVRCPAEHRVYARKTLWGGQRIGWQVHLFGLTRDFNGCEYNRILELSFTRNAGRVTTQGGAWAGKIKTVPGCSRPRIDPVGEVLVVPVR